MKIGGKVGEPDYSVFPPVFWREGESAPLLAVTLLCHPGVEMAVCHCVSGLDVGKNVPTMLCK